MEAAGWVAAAVAGVAGCVSFLGYVFDQVPALSQKAIRAVRSLRALRNELKRTGKR